MGYEHRRAARVCLRGGTATAATAAAAAIQLCQGLFQKARRYSNDPAVPDSSQQAVRSHIHTAGVVWCYQGVLGLARMPCPPLRIVRPAPRTKSLSKQGAGSPSKLPVALAAAGELQCNTSALTEPQQLDLARPPTADSRQHIKQQLLHGLQCCRQ